MFVRLVTCLLGEPIILDHLSYVCEHLLVSGINEVKFISPPGIADHYASTSSSECGWGCGDLFLIILTVLLFC